MATSPIVRWCCVCGKSFTPTEKDPVAHEEPAFCSGACWFRGAPTLLSDWHEQAKQNDIAAAILSTK